MHKMQRTQAMSRLLVLPQQIVIARNMLLRSRVQYAFIYTYIEIECRNLILHYSYSNLAPSKVLTVPIST